jgi:hypothetical protein
VTGELRVQPALPPERGALGTHWIGIRVSRMHEMVATRQISVLDNQTLISIFVSGINITFDKNEFIFFVNFSCFFLVDRVRRCL